MNITLEGCANLVKKLDYLGGNSMETVMKGLYFGAEKIKQDARAIVPAKTGHLRQSITVEKIPNGYQVGTNEHYAAFVEYGTGTKGDPAVPHTARKSWRYKDANGVWHTSHGMKAHPYMRPSCEKNRTYVVKMVRSQLIKALNERMGG